MKIFFIIFFVIISTSIIAQTTFAESAAGYNLNIGGSKDGGHAWADYDLDGDFDLVINTNGRGYLLRNDGGSFTDVTNINGNLAPDLLNGSLERTALFVDFNNDGYPDIFRNDHNNVKIYLQDPATNRFGNGTGGTVPNQHFTTLTDGLNSEGAGALDYDGDGDLDLFIDNHNFGIDILQNDGTGNFTHVTRKADSPTTYNAGDPTTWPLGLAQDATDGDYGSATDFNNDGWVDIVVRKQNQVDLFTNLGGTFQDGVDIDEADNNNKGAVAFYDFDNDGDFDLYWTENGTNQIHQNNGDGTWTGLGAATGIPVNFPGQMEGIACGDVDNDGDIDIYLGNGGSGGGHRSKLYLNQGSMTFVDSGLTFNNNNEGSTFIDIDEDGDLDLYVNKNGSANELWINNLGAAQANHLYIDILEDRDTFGLINLETRFGNGATATILDCAGNVISGIREVNGGYGHGTQEPGVIHFGLPGGPNTPIVLEVAYPRHGSGSNDRVVVREELTPSDPAFRRGNINIITILPTSGNQAPIATDDEISTTENIAVTFDPLIDNDNGVDSDPDGHPISVISVTQPANGTAVLNGDGTITYTPDAGFFGSDPFTYTIEDNTSCTLVNIQSVGNIIMTVNPDNDDDGIADIADFDDDNDGILDTVEDNCSATETLDWESASYGWAGNTTSNSYLVGTTTVDIVATSNGSNFKLEEKDAPHGGISPFEKVVETKHNPDSSGDLLTVTFTFSNDVKDFQISLFDIDAKIDNWQDQVTVTGYHNGNTVSSNIVGSADNSVSGNTITGNVETPDANVGSGDGNVDINFSSYIDTFVIEYGSGPLAKSNPDEDKIGIYDFSFLGCTIADTDGDGIINSFDLDSDNDGILDAEEAGHGIAHTNGVIVGSVGTDGIPDSVQASPNDENTSYTIAESTDDSDTIPNFLDLDSDGDGLPDNVEAQTTIGYIPPNPDSPATYTTNNGVNSAYLGGLTPTNTDGADNPDYLDIDSDNEGNNDTTEAGITLSGNDSDNDGLDDTTDNTADYSDPGGTIDNPLSGSLILPDIDTDALTGGNVDFRDATDDRLDSDGDGIFDTVDIDDDNDGIPDAEENANCYGGAASGLVFSEDFGAGNRTTTPYTNYTYEPNDWPVGGGSISDGEYAILNDIINSASWAAAFWVNKPDHTGDANGRMALFNSTNSALEEFYNRNNINVTPNTLQEFSFWVLNLDLASTPNTRTLPNITAFIKDNSGATVLSTLSTGGVIKDEEWHNYKFTFNPGANTQINLVLINRAIGGLGNDLVIDDLEIQILCDTDGDGIVNSLDLDSDNDGIFDVVEAGHGQAQTNGVIDGVPAAFGSNGLFNGIENDDTSSATITYSIGESSDDADAIPNYLDLDSDGDGIPDNVEAQTTTGYNPPSGTVDINGVYTNYTSGLDPTNTDGADNPDYLDLDSDNEGGSDTTEAGITLAGVDTDNDGLDDNIDTTADYSDPGGTIDNPLSGGVILTDVDNDASTGGDVDFRDALDDRSDNDNDGIADVDDIDDDNDGILDTDEGCGNLVINGNFEAQDFTDAITFPNGFTSANGTFIGSTYNTNTLYGWDYTQNIDGWVGGVPLGANTFAEAYSRIQYLDIIGNNSASSPIGENNVLSQTIPTIVGQSYILSFYWGEDIGHRVGAPVEMDVRVRDAVTTAIIQSQNLTTTATGIVGGVVGPKNWFAYSQVFTATSTQTTIEFESTPDGTANGTALDYVSVFKNGTCQDTDNDGVIDAFDLDSDNDGILDAVEAGHNQPHTNGVVNGVVGDDGLPDAVQDSPNNEQTNYSIAESTDDADAIPNYLDLDADGDGLPDNVEAQTTTGYNPPSGTVDANGVFTNYTGGLTPEDTDGDLVPDYLDTDSDNEGGNDTTEAGITLANADADNDGLDDNTDATANYSDPGGTIDDPLTAPVILPDVDNDATTGGDVDYRDAESDADLSLRKTVNNSSPDQGATITFTLTITNSGLSSPTNIVVQDVLPADFTFLNASPATGTVNFNAGTRVLTWDLDTYVLAATVGSNTITMTYTVRVDVCGEFTNQAEITNSSLADPDSTPNNGN